MRALLINWLNDVCADFLFKRDTYYLAVNYFDRYMSLDHKITRNKLQLLGITSLLVAAKMEEVFTPTVESLAEAANRTYSVREIVQLEN